MSKTLSMTPNAVRKRAAKFRKELIAHRELLAQALESGEFKQSGGYLTVTKGSSAHPEGDCCLGVACKVYSRFNKPLITEDYYSTAKGVHVLRYRHENEHEDDGHSEMPPMAVKEWFGLTTNTTGTLAHRNDCGHTFQDIAKAIRSIDPKSGDIRDEENAN